MQAGGDRSSKSESLQAVVQVGELGFYPLNSLAVSALHHGQVRCILAQRESGQQDKVRLKTELTVGAETLSVAGTLFSGLSDAFYRGRLPEVVVVTVPMSELPVFIEELMDFLEKLCSLGFLTEKEQDDIILLNRYVPQFVLASYGLYYEVMLTKLETALSNLGRLTPRQKERLLQKFSRGVWISPGLGYDTQLMPLTLYPKPLSLNLAGSKSMLTIRTTQVLEANHLPHHFNPNGELGVMELELNLAFHHLTQRLLPGLPEAEVSAAELSEDFEALGQKLGLLPGLVTVAPTKKAMGKLPPEVPAMMDLAMLHQLAFLSEGAQLITMTDRLQALLEAAKAKVPAPAPASVE